LVLVAPVAEQVAMALLETIVFFLLSHQVAVAAEMQHLAVRVQEVCLGLILVALELQIKGMLVEVQRMLRATLLAEAGVLVRLALMA
jgi:hypothetical protein